MKNIIIIGSGCSGLASSIAKVGMVDGVVVIDTLGSGIVESKTQSPFAPEPFPIKAPPPMPEICYFNPLNEGKRTRAIRREQERKKKRKR
jgi:hypothetical protein